MRKPSRLYCGIYLQHSLLLDIETIIYIVLLTIQQSLLLSMHVVKVERKDSPLTRRNFQRTRTWISASSHLSGSTGGFRRQSRAKIPRSTDPRVLSRMLSIFIKSETLMAVAAPLAASSKRETQGNPYPIPDMCLKMQSYRICHSTLDLNQK